MSRDRVPGRTWLLSGFALLASFGASAAACPEIAPWLEVSALATAGPTVASRVAAQAKEFDARSASARATYQSFLAGRLDVAGLEACLAGHAERGSFLATLYATFYRETIDQLRASRAPIIKNLVASLDRRSGAGIPLFRMTGHFDEKSPIGYKAGYHRASGSIFVDWSRVSPDEWQVILVHELLHSLDESIWTAQAVYADAARVKRIVQSAEETSDLAQLAPVAAAELEGWIRAGLDRGLWAEYRAWNITFAVYREGLQEGRWKPIAWAESILREQRVSGLEFDPFLYAYLDARSVDPTTGIFSLPLVQAALRGARGQALLPRGLPALGNLGELLAR